MTASQAVVIFCSFGTERPLPTGSGTEIRPGVILTACHVLYKGEKPGKRAEVIRIGWLTDQNNFEFETVFEDCWEDSELDLALLRAVGRPSSIPEPYVSLSTSELAAHQKFDGFGYPWVGDVGGQPARVALLGYFAAPEGSVAKATLDLDISESWTTGKSREKIDKALGGASGTGLFSDKQLVAVFLGRHPSVQQYNTRSVVSLLQPNGGFSQKLNEWAPSNKFDGLLDDSLGQLSETNLAALKDRCRPGECRSLTEFLSSVLELIKKERGAEQRDRLRTIALWTTLRFLDQHAPVKLDSNKLQSRGGIIVQSGHVSGAELSMAVAECRMPEFRVDGSWDPPGKKNVSAPPPRSFSGGNDTDEFAELEGRIGLDLEKFSALSMKKIDQLIGNAANTEDREYKKRAIIYILKMMHGNHKFYFEYEKDNKLAEDAAVRIGEDYDGMIPVIIRDTKSEFALAMAEPLLWMAAILNSGNSERKK